MRRKLINIYNYLILFIICHITLLQANNITNVKDSLTNYASGKHAVHKLSFTINRTVGYAGRFSITFNGPTTPPEQRFILNKNTVISASFGKLSRSPKEDKVGGLIIDVSADGDTLFLYRDGKGGDIYGGTEIEIYIGMIKNPSKRRENIRLGLATWDLQDYKWEIFDSTTTNPLFSIDGKIETFSFDSLATQKAGQPFLLRISNAEDNFHNPASGSVAITPLSGGGPAPDGTIAIFDTIRVNNGVGVGQQLLVKKENGVVLQGTATETGFTATTNPFNVIAGNATELEITGEPSSAVAGVRFSNPITVTAYDSYRNIADTYTGTVSFNNSDPLKQAGDLPNPSTLDNGTKTFAGSQFLLRSAGDRKIWVGDGTLADTTRAIRVTANTIHSFSISIATPIIAGQNAAVTVSNAVDAYGNPANGTVILTFVDGGEHTIGGFQPVLPNIQVINGSGTVYAIFFKAENVSGLRGTSIGGSQPQATTGPFAVNPGPLASLRFYAHPTDNPLPTTRMAGETLGSNTTYLRVEDRDAYTNIKTDFTGSIYFTSTDNNAILPHKQANPYTFTGGELGVKDFARNTFSFRTAGYQNITVVSGSITQSLNPIQVLPNVISNFNLVATTLQYAGQQFLLQVTNARDAYGNYGNGLAEIRLSDGNHASPRGDVPIITNVPIFNGSGSASQILVRTETVQFIGEVKEGGVVRASATTSPITVLPGNLGRLDISGTPSWVLAGSSFPNNVTVRAFDLFGNDKTNYNGTIRFESSDVDPNISLPFNYTFSNTNIAIFSGSLFRLLTPGVQTIYVTDWAAGIQGISSPIDVGALKINRVYSNASLINYGQQNILVFLKVKNLSQTKTLTDVTGELHFKLGNQNRDIDYIWERIPPTTVNLSPNSTATLQFRVNVRETAVAGDITVDGYAFGNYDGLPVSAFGAITDSTHTWSLRSGTVEITDIRPSQPTVTQNQTTPWYIDVVITNKMAAPIRINFDTTKTFIRLRQGGYNYTSSYQIAYPVELLEGGDTIEADSSRHLRYIITRVGPQLGTFSIYSRVETIDGFAVSDAFGTYNVQSPPDIRITRLIPSQMKVTAGDSTHHWYVDAVVSNLGGSAVAIDSLASHLIFSDGSGFVVKPPHLLHLGDVLAAGQTDTLRFRVVKNGTNLGFFTVDALVSFRVINTAQQDSLLSAPNLRRTLEVQNPAECFISNIRVSQPYITQGTTVNWWVTVILNSKAGGGDVEVNLDSSDSTYVRLFRGFDWQSGYVFSLPTKLAGSGNRILKAGIPDSLVFPISSMGSTTGEMKIICRVGGVELNMAKPLVFSNIAPKTVRIQLPANITFIPNSLQPSYVSAGRYYSFQINATNTGESSVELDPLKTIFEFTDGNEVFSTRLDASKGTILPGYSTKTLYFNANNLPSTFSTGLFPTRITLRGSQNGSLYEQVFTLNDNRITVGDPQQLMINSLRAEVGSVTAGQQKPWTIRLEITNNGINTLLLDSARVAFYYGLQDISNKFTVSRPDTFVNNGKYLRGQSTNILRFTVTEVDAATELGQVIIAGRIWLSDSVQTFRHFDAQTDQGNAGAVMVQAPAVLRMPRLTLSQNTVTRGQYVPWYIQVSVKNEGGSQVELLPNQTRLDFSKGNDNFAIQVPGLFEGSGSVILPPNAEDSLKFTVLAVNGQMGMLGACTVDATITAIESNSDRVLSINSQSIGRTRSITIQDSAAVRIDSIKVDVPLKTFVNAGQRFYLKAKVHNPSSGDWVKQAQIAFFGGTFSEFVSGSVAVIDSIAAGVSKWTEPGVLVAAQDISDVFETYHARIIGSVAHNTNQVAKVLLSTSARDTSVTVTFQRPGILAINKVSASKDTIPSGYILPWYIYVDIANTGQGALILEKPSAEDVIIKPGFVIEPPVLEGEDAILHGGETFRLVYTVTASSAASGPTMVTVRVRARDGNDPTRIIQPLTGQKSIFISTTARARIAQTFIDPEQFNVDEASVAHVNQKQVFSVFVKVENNGGQDLDTVRVRLRANRSKVLPPHEQVIEKLRVTEGYRQVVFNVQADSVENLIAETLVADITKAVGEDLSLATVSPAQDSTVVIKIYQPALLRISSTRVIVPQPDKKVSYGQTFPVEVKVENLGSEPVRNITIRLQANPDNRLQIASPTLVVPGQVSRGDTGKVTFLATADAISGRVSLRSSIVTSEGMNNRLPAPILTTGQNDSAHVLVETAAKLKISSVVAPEEVTAGDSQNNWRIYVNVENEGDADLKFLDISAANITFITNGIIDKDYRVNAPAKLSESDSLILRGKHNDQLLYVVTRNGEIAGRAEIRVQLKAMDLNKEVTPDNVLTATASTNISVSSVAWVRVNKTVCVTPNKDINGRGLVNRGRTFHIQVEAETGELSGVDSVKVRLTSNGRSFIRTPTFIIPNIPRAGKGTADFEVIADDFWDAKVGEVVEVFTATIESAKAVSSRLDAQIKSPERLEDAMAIVRVQNPARISLHLLREAGQDSVYATGEEFKIISQVKNSGTAPAEQGIIRIVLPAGKGYQLVAGSQERLVHLPLGVYSKSDTFIVRAPNGNSLNDTIFVQLVQAPLDINTNSIAAVQNSNAYVVISTVTSFLSLSFDIYGPNGAKDRIISTGQQVLLRAIIETSANIREKTARIILPSTPKYNIFGNSEIEIKQNPDTVIWNIQAPETETSLPHTFTAEVKGNSADGWQTRQRTVTIDQIVKRADLRLENFEVSYPIEGVMEGGQARFSVSQQATLRARVLNSGKASVTGSGKLTLYLQQSGLRLLEADSTKPFIVGSFTTWNVMASDVPITDLRDIRVEITSVPNDENTNMPAHITSSFSTLITRTDERGTVRIDKFYISSPVGAVDNTLSTDQNFEIVAEITSTSVRDLMAEIGWTGSFQSKVSPIAVPVGTRQQVTWTMIAPSEPSTETISLMVTAKDYRSGTPLLNQTRNISVITQNKTFFSLVPRITFPKNLTNKISSEVPFDLTLYIRHKPDTAPYYTTDETTVQIYVPASFSDGSESLIKSGRDSIVWHFTAPKVRQDTLYDFNFELRGLPRDANSGLQASVDFMRVYYPIWVVKRAQLALNARVNEAVTNEPVAIRVGNEFNIVAFLENMGSADIYGEYQLRLRLPAGYTTKQTTQIRTDQKMISWNVKAPDQSRDRPDTITVKMLSAPLDYFSKARADVVKDSAFVLVSPEAGVMVAKVYNVNATAMTLKSGTDIPMLGLYLQNKDEAIDNKSLLDTLIVTLRDRRGSPIAANTVIRRIAAVRHDPPYGLLTENVNPGNSNRVLLNFRTAAADTIKGNTPYKIDLIVDIHPQTTLTDFTVAIDSASFIIARDAIYRNRLVIADSNLTRSNYLGFTSGTMTIMAEELKESFCNYPNPFGTTTRPITKFVYYLRQPSDIQLKIYTLTGELVRSWHFTKAEHPKQTSQGIHRDDIIWDGKNGRGEPVMNGIYLAYLLTEFDERALTKIAVVK